MYSDKDGKMNQRIKELLSQAGVHYEVMPKDTVYEKFAELIVRECADICIEMAAKCAGLEGDGALAKDCAYWIKKDFGVEE
jgi:hypothetical protein